MHLNRPSARHLALVAGLAGSAVITPAAAQATVRASTYSYKVQVNAGVLTSTRTVKATATVQNPDSRVKDWWSYPTVKAVVRKGVNGEYQEPYSIEGYRCTPTVRGQTTSFDCKLRGADVATTIDLRYSVRYRAH